MWKMWVKVDGVRSRHRKVMRVMCVILTCEGNELEMINWQTVVGRLREG